MKWQPYPEYKESSMNWPEEIPTHWETKRVKRVFDVINGSTPKSSEPTYWDGSIPWATPNDLGKLAGDTILKTERSITQEGYESCGTKLVPAGSLVLSTRAPIGHLAIAGVNLCTNQGCRALTFHSKEDVHFFYYQLLAARPNLESLGRGSTFLELGRDELEFVPLAYPPFLEQRTIAAFLDRQTAHIDALIAKKERQIELLQEKRAALISHAVTKGLDPDVPMKDSGVEWLGEIPAHWEAFPLKFAVLQKPDAIKTGPFGSQLLSSEMMDSEVKVYNQRNVIDQNLAQGDNYISREKYEELQAFTVYPGDVLLTTRGTIGRCVIVPDDAELGVLHPCLMRIQPDPRRLLTRFLILLVQDSFLVQTQLFLMSNATTIEVIYSGNLREAIVPIPPVTEQHTITAYLYHETAKLDALTTKVQESIERLQEYRTALISAAVTGKIDVRCNALPKCVAPK